MKGQAIARGLKQHWTVKHGKMVPKLQFKTLAEVLDYIEKHHINRSKYHPYICSDCGQWHIGHSNKRKKYG